MASWSQRRQFFYLSLGAGVLVLLIGGFLWWRWPDPGCFDGVKNNNEVGIDCGGSCARVCRTEVEPLTVQWVRLLPEATSTYAVAALIENANPRHGVAALGYTIWLVDRDNGNLVRRSGTTFANPRERFLIYEYGFTTGVRQAARAFIELELNPTWLAIRDPAPTLSVQKTDFRSGPTARLSATVRNDTLSVVSNLRVPVVLSNADRTVVAASDTFIERLPPGGSEEIIYTWPGALPDDIVFVDFYPRVNLTVAP